MRYSILTLGCKVNQAESIDIEKSLSAASYLKVALEENPDICLVNTCSVTAKSDYQSRQLIRRALISGARVFVTGCYSELNKEEIRGIDRGIEIIENSDKALFLKKTAGEPIGDRHTVQHIFQTGGRARGFIKIQDGCNAECAYCIIPLARGKSRSRPADDIIREIGELESVGFTEVVITGIHIGLYGLDLSPALSLSRLVEFILSETERIRLRLSSVEVNEIDERLFELLGERRVCNHLHVPLQSGADKVLEAMKRPYACSEYREVIERLNRKLGDISLGADVIVGFPGEDDSSFNDTYTFIKQLPLTYLHVFPFSGRKKTKAFTLPNQVDEGVKKMRAAMLRSLSSEKKRAFIEKQMKKTLFAVVEKRSGATFYGTTDNYLKIKFDAPEGSEDFRERDLIALKVIDFEGDVLIGKQV